MAQLFGRELNLGTGAIDETYVDNNGNVTDRSIINNDALMEQNLQDRLADNNGFSQSRNLRKIAEIDAVTQLKLLNEHNIDFNRWNYEDQTAFKKWLKQPDNAYFRTYSGTI